MSKGDWLNFDHMYYTTTVEMIHELDNFFEKKEAYRERVKIKTDVLEHLEYQRDVLGFSDKGFAIEHTKLQLKLYQYMVDNAYKTVYNINNNWECF